MAGALLTPARTLEDLDELELGAAIRALHDRLEVAGDDDRALLERVERRLEVALARLLEA